MISPLGDIGRAGEPGTAHSLIRCQFPRALVAVTISTTRTQRIYLSASILAPDVARAGRHIVHAHLLKRGVGICWSPACATATVLVCSISEPDLAPPIASSA